MEFISNNNKELIWGILQETNIFNGIESNHFNKIHQLFEDTISTIHTNSTNMTLLEKNKVAMDTLIKKINGGHHKPSSNQNTNPIPVEIIYKSEDLQQKRSDDFNIKLKEQQDNLNTLINPNKPKDISFIDETSSEDKPIGEEMDRLIAERLASRERELEIPSMTAETETWINNNRDVKLTIDDKKVSFNENINEIKDESYQTYQSVEKSKIESTPEKSIFNKLKRKPIEIVEANATSDVKPNFNIEMELKKMRETQDKIVMMCSTILSTLQSKP